MRRFGVLALSLASCSAPSEEPPTEPPRVNEPAESRPLRQGFTQRPSPDTPGLPPPIRPMLSEAEAEAAAARAGSVDQAAKESAQNSLRALVDQYETAGEPEVLARILEHARKLAREGRLAYRTVEELYAEYLFPNVESEVDARYKGKLVLLTGTVAPHNMRDFADGFKLIEQNPYVHDPLLLATDYELSFVECRLARPEAQPLRDWQPIHFLAEVQGKRRSDLLLGRCIVLSGAMKGELSEASSP